MPKFSFKYPNFTYFLTLNLAFGVVALKYGSLKVKIVSVTEMQKSITPINQTDFIICPGSSLITANFSKMIEKARDENKIAAIVTASIRPFAGPKFLFPAICFIKAYFAGEYIALWIAKNIVIVKAK